VIGGSADAESGEAAPGAAATSGPGGESSVIRTREDAYRQLERVADYFRGNEPHNPISYALEQAVRWSKMPLPELLTELISDKGPREELFRLLGIRQPDS
jgi:type VI secretion system protein ImpA